jgi:hypothetical protein
VELVVKQQGRPTPIRLLGIDTPRSGLDARADLLRFDDFTAYGLDQALGYAKGFDRAMAACSADSVDA